MINYFNRKLANRYFLIQYKDQKTKEGGEGKTESKVIFMHS